MKLRCWTIVSAVVIAAAGCQKDTDGGGSQALTTERRASVEESVRRFAASVAQDITQDGPAAWNKEFADDPAFFMASEGQLVFPNRQAAAQAIEGLTRTIQHIELRWGSDLRIDALTQDYAVVGATFYEVRVDMQGHRVDETGFFTGLAEQREGKWQFRNAHWSVPVQPAKVP